MKKNSKRNSNYVCSQSFFHTASLHDKVWGICPKPWRRWTTVLTFIIITFNTFRMEACVRSTDSLRASFSLIRTLRTELRHRIMGYNVWWLEKCETVCKRDWPFHHAAFRKLIHAPPCLQFCQLGWNSCFFEKVKATQTEHNLCVCSAYVVKI